MKTSKILFFALVLCGSCVCLLAARDAAADSPNYVNFFRANNGSFQAHLDLNNQSTSASGRSVNVKLDSFNQAFRDMAKKNWPGGENSAYAIEGYTVNCSSRQVGENLLVFYDQNGFPLTGGHDLGGAMKTPLTGSLKFYLMQKVCGQ